MKKYLFIFLVFLLPNLALSEGGSLVDLAKAPIDPHDIASIKRGAQFFASNCMSCHTLVYMRYNKLAQDAGITYEKMPINVKTWPFGVSPPDLSLEVDVKGADWIYTYLHSFYQDPTRPSGVNNLVFVNTAMPGIITPFQGLQERIKAEPDKALFHELQWFDLLVLQKQGSMSPDQFDKTITDLVNFLNYCSYPYEIEQNWLGWWVLGFMVVFFCLVYRLKVEYWKDVKKKH